MIADDTLFDFARHCQDMPKNYYGEVYSKDQIRQIFAFVKENHYPLFKDFYECSASKLGGKL
jgi:threonine aldolase